MEEEGGEREKKRGGRGGEAEAGIGMRGEEEAVVEKGMTKEAETGGRGEAVGEAGALREGERRRQPLQTGMDLQFLRSTRMQSGSEQINNANWSRNSLPWPQ